jgi:hypothetical protein
MSIFAVQNQLFMNTLSRVAAVFSLFVVLASCSKKSEEKKIDPSNSNELQSVLVIPNGTLTSGTPPPTTTGTSRPSISSNQSSGSVTSGGQVNIPFSYSSASGGYTNCYVQVNNATNGYIRIPTPSSNTSGTINIPITVPSNVNSGQFCITYCIADAQNRVSNYMTFCVDVTAPVTGGGGSGVGTGNFKVDGVTNSGYCSAYSPSASGTNGTDVVITTTSGNSFIIYNIPTASSGSASFVDGYYNNTGLWCALNTSSFFGASKPGGTVTKTGAKSFTFSATVYDLNTNQQKSVTGSGTWQ